MTRTSPDLTFEKPSSLKPWGENPRVNDHVVDRLCAVIRRFGFSAPIVANREERMICAGHTRWKAAMKLGLDEVPVRWMDLPLGEAKALALSDNKIGELAHWNDDLATLIYELKQEDHMITDLGWDAEELTALLDSVIIVDPHTRKPTSGGDGGQATPARIVPGEATLLHGDCLHRLRDLPDNSVDAIVTDPPYGLSEDPDIADVMRHWLSGDEYDTEKPGFMGEKWDSFVPGPSVWRECFRVLKPGGHLIAFAGTRTHDLMGIAIRFAGFEKRDLGQWLYYSGMPKNLDISKEMDRQKCTTEEMLQLCAWIREARDAAGLTNQQIDDAFGTNGMASHWCSKGSQPLIPTLEQWPVLLALLGSEPSGDVAKLATRIVRPAHAPGEAWFERETTHTENQVDANAARPGMPSTGGGVPHKPVPKTTAASSDARRWSGWGTALKPTHEPWLLYRKPREAHGMTIADNVRRHGTGGLNIDATRHAPGDPMWPGPNGANTKSSTGDIGLGLFGLGGTRMETGGHELGRWPSNTVHVRKPSQTEKQAGCEAIAPVSGADAVKRKKGSKGIHHPRAGAGRTRKSVHNNHKTVKPIRLMAWLVRLVTPPGGHVLDPFMGSGTTGIAAVCQGFRFTGIELRERFVSVSGQRIAYWKEHTDELRQAIDTDTGEEEEDEEGAE